MLTTPTDQTDTISEAQRRFDEMYITAAQIMRDLDLTRGALLYARRTGKLPSPIVLNEGRLLIWEKSSAQPYIDAWKSKLDARRGI